jgi:hypothetical protein
MCELLTSVINCANNLNWSSVLSAVANVANISLAITAIIALNTWKGQTRAQLKTKFLDELSDSVHEYIQAMGAPIAILEFVKIGIQAYSETPSFGENKSKHSGIINYIVKNGKEDQERLIKHIDKVRPISSRMISLATKGQVFGFHNYTQCYNACKMLAWSHGQIEAFTSIIGNTHLNWENDIVQQTLDKVMTIDAESIKKNVEEQNYVFLTFMKHAYKVLLE